MAFQYYFCIDEASDKKSLYLYDDTGVYNASTNATGYNTPNPTVAQVTAASLTVTFPNAAQTPVTLDVFSVSTPYPNTDEVPYNITNVMLGIDTDTLLDDGVYYFVGSVSGIKSSVPFTSEYSFYKVFHAKLDAYFDSKTTALKVPDADCTCPTNANFQLERLKNLLRSAKDAACNGRATEAKEIMAYLVNITGCNSPLTKCCN